MSVQAVTKKQNITLRDIAAELGNIRRQLEKILLLVPEESLKEYKNSSKIKKAYHNAIKAFPP